MDGFLERWQSSAATSVGLFWTAFWAFALGYLISSMIQVFVTRSRMKKAMGRAGAGSVGLAAFFGFLSSSCSFAALSTTRSLFTKGAGLIPSLAFLLASTNLVVELGIVIAVFLSWQFVVGEYAGGLLLILCMWLLVRLRKPEGLIRKAREHARRKEHGHGDDDEPDWRTLIRSRTGWLRVARTYGMEWGMVWKDVTVGFTVAGIIATFIPPSFFRALFVGSGEGPLSFWHVVVQAVVGPVAAFFTFIGSMGNIPLAAVLFGNGVSFAGVMAFIFSDLVVFPVLRIHASYYGWKMALYILAVMLVSLVVTAVAMHYGFAAAGLLPDTDHVRSMTERTFFALDLTLVLNALFLIVTAGFLLWTRLGGNEMHHHHDHGDESGVGFLFVAAILALAWLAGGWLVPPLILSAG